MELLPAVDIKDGRCVRLQQGDFEREQVFDADPAAAARRWYEGGADRVHVVDLDGARHGERQNLSLIREMVTAGLPLQVGGGIRDYAGAIELLELGVRRIIIGTAAVRNAELRRRLAAEFGRRVMVGVDCRSGQLAVEGWEKQLELPVVDFCETLCDEGIERVVLTDIERDGMLSGPNLELTRQVLATGIGVIASGGVGRLEHLQQLRSLAREAPGLEGVIVGQALYRGRFTLEEALNVLHDQQGGD